jgi:hypothetical protein
MGTHTLIRLGVCALITYAGTVLRLAVHPVHSSPLSGRQTPRAQRRHLAPWGPTGRARGGSPASHLPRFEALTELGVTGQ